MKNTKEMTFYGILALFNQQAAYNNDGAWAMVNFVIMLVCMVLVLVTYLRD